jgi:hypothetical protein
MMYLRLSEKRAFQQQDRLLQNLPILQLYRPLNRLSVRDDENRQYFGCTVHLNEIHIRPK